MKFQILTLVASLVLAGYTCSAQECLPDDDRVDCHPDNGATTERCLQRGCTWCDATTPGRNTPTCFFPRNYGYKMVGEPVNTGHGYRVLLERSVTSTLFGGDATNLTVEVDYQSDYRFRVKITDNDKDHWEVPLEVFPPSGGLTNPMYDVQFENEPVFSFRVIRKATGTVLFDSSLGGFNFADQFIHMGWKLPSKDVYGIGENEQHSLRHNFENRPSYPLFSSGLFPDGNKNLYGVHPQYTVLEDDDGNTHTMVIVNSNAQEIEMHPSPGIVFKSTGGIFDMYFFLGPTPEDTAIQYSEAMGRFPMPPYWSLGFHLCKHGYHNISTLKDVVDRMVASGIPYDVQYGDIDIMDRNRDFTVSADRFPGLKEYVQELHSKGLKFMTILDPCIDIEEPNGTYRAFDLGQEMDVWVKRSDGSPVQGRMWPDGDVYFPDYTKNSTREWWMLMIKEFHDEVLEFDALWIDMNEPSNFVTGDVEGCAVNELNNPPFYPKSIRDGHLGDNTICPDHRDSISTHYNTHSMYGWFQSEPTYAGTNEAVGKRSFILSRSNFIGQSRWATHWLGDNYANWENMYYSIIGIFQYQLFAMPFVGADICGHQLDAEVQLCQRWHQLGAFYPFSRNHNAYGLPAQDPAAFDGAIIESTKKAFMVRYTLLPYFYGLLARHEKWGETVWRPMWNLYPKDSVARGIDRQIFWGSTIMVTPVLTPNATTVEAYFPDGRFFDYYTGAEVGVRESYTNLSAPLDHINVHVHGGNIIATQDPAVNTEISRNNPFGLIVALNDNQEATGSFFWDDGESFNTMQTGYYFIAQMSAGNATLNYVAWRDTYPDMEKHVVDTIRLLGVSPSPTKITVNGLAHSNFTVLPSKEVLVQNLNLVANKDFVLKYE